MIGAVEQITPAWLTEALREAGNDLTVDSLEATPIGTGQMSQSIRVVHRSSGPDAETIPSSLVVKLPGLSEAARAGGAGGAYPSEVRFYSSIADTVAIAVPGCHLARLGDDPADFVLILDDMAPANQGDQIAGCTESQANAAVTALAGLAGPRWGDPTLMDVDGLDRPSPETAGFWGAVFHDAVVTFRERYRDRLRAEDAEILEGAAQRMTGWMLGRPERFSLIHGDFRLDNLLFDPDDGATVTTVDWQTLGIGLPARDLAYFCGTSLEVAPRRTLERKLVGTYTRALAAHGVRGYSEDTCWDDYRFGLLQAPLITVLGAAYADPTTRGDEMFLTMARRSCQAMVDLSTFEVIDRDGSAPAGPVA